jgi:TrmH family RNA methyltransferase
MACPGVVLDLYVAESGQDRQADLVAAAERTGVPVRLAPDSAITELSDTVTPQGIVAVCGAVDVSLETALVGTPQLVVLADQVRDPGNLGTLIRCADAFGADAVLVSADSVEAYNPKTVRASTGSLFHLPITLGVDVGAAVGQARTAGLAVLGADGDGRDTLDGLDRLGALNRPILWVLGNEAWGLPAGHADLMDRLVRVPLYGRAESLNLSTAAAVLLYATSTAQRNTAQATNPSASQTSSPGPRLSS